MSLVINRNSEVLWRSQRIGCVHRTGEGFVFFPDKDGAPEVRDGRLSNLRHKLRRSCLNDEKQTQQ